MIHNPILPGFYPDPSICCVGQDFYIVTSSFSYFPGVPVFHSKDLMHWEQIGHVLDREEQLHVTYEDVSMGIFAPTIRCYEGTFYLITTNMTTHENFICTAANPAGEWSNPHVITAAKGIDPSLFFDDDGKVYFMGTSSFTNKKYDHQVIICSEIDLKTFQLIGEEWVIGDGALKNAWSPEGPHIYKKDNWYYLLIAEGGTEHYHAVTISRSKNIRGPFENYAGNPILTHRHLGKNYPISNVGHADMIELPDGSWYMVCLASRLVGGYHKPMGRETFIAPVTWEDGWPVVSLGTGKLEWEYPAPNLTKKQYPAVKQESTFEGKTLGMEWNYLGTPYQHFTRIADKKLYIRMLKKNLIPSEFEGEEYNFFGHMEKLGNTRENMPFVGKRMTATTFEARALLEVHLNAEECAGIAIYQNNANHLRLECQDYDKDKIRFAVRTVRFGLPEGKMHYEETTVGCVELPESTIYELKIYAAENLYSFSVIADGAEYYVAKDVDGSYIGSESAGGFVGAYIGLFATGNGVDSSNEAAFHCLTISNNI